MNSLHRAYVAQSLTPISLDIRIFPPCRLRVALDRWFFFRLVIRSKGIAARLLVLLELGIWLALRFVGGAVILRLTGSTRRGLLVLRAFAQFVIRVLRVDGRVVSVLVLILRLGGLFLLGGVDSHRHLGFMCGCKGSHEFEACRAA